MAADCVFCKIVAGEIPVECVYQTDTVMVFPDANPQAPVHVLVIPKRHVENLDQSVKEDSALVADCLAASSGAAELLGVDGAYRLVSNCGEAAGQSVMHLHFHVLGGRNLTWPPG